MAKFSQTPFPEIIRSYVLPRLPVAAVVALCATHPHYRHWCQDEQLWADIAQRDYPGTQRLPGQSWLGLIRELQEYRLVPVLSAGETWHVLVRKGMSLAELAQLIFYLPYIVGDLDRQQPITLAIVQQAASRLGICPIFRGGNMRPVYNYSRLSYPATGHERPGMAVILTRLTEPYHYMLDLAPSPANNIEVHVAHARLTYPPTTVLARTILRPWRVNHPALTLYSAIERLDIVGPH
jgi:hypothetical protein